MTTDLLLEGRHFVAGCDPESLGHKALAVNLSDLAAAGARRAASTLALALPAADEAWLAAFCARPARRWPIAHGCVLAGGDTTRAPQLETARRPADRLHHRASARCRAGRRCTRGGARPGDDVWVSDTVGDARAGAGGCAAAACAGSTSSMRRRCRRGWIARSRAWRSGMALRGIATACIDVSDGLLGDLAHIVRALGRRRRSRVAGACRCQPALRRQPVAMPAALRAGRRRRLRTAVHRPGGRAPARCEAAARAGGRGGGAHRHDRRRVRALRVVDEHGPRADGARSPAFDHFA
ncbi:MAG: AIR synthase related protein [Comamonadaceae bacterium]|nr:AIR synthase related protein [Comamonadaceae bacterium]